MGYTFFDVARTICPTLEEDGHFEPPRGVLGTYMDLMDDMFRDGVIPDVRNYRTCSLSNSSLAEVRSKILDSGYTASPIFRSSTVRNMEFYLLSRGGIFYFLSERWESVGYDALRTGYIDRSNFDPSLLPWSSPVSAHEFLELSKPIKESLNNSIFLKESSGKTYLDLFTAFNPRVEDGVFRSLSYWGRTEDFDLLERHLLNLPLVSTPHYESDYSVYAVSVSKLHAKLEGGGLMCTPYMGDEFSFHFQVGGSIFKVLSDFYTQPPEEPRSQITGVVGTVRLSSRPDFNIPLSAHEFLEKTIDLSSVYGPPLEKE